MRVQTDNSVAISVLLKSGARRIDSDGRLNRIRSGVENSLNLRWRAASLLRRVGIERRR